MLKANERTDPQSCFNRARPHEMIFVLLARDIAAPRAIRAWAEERVLLGKNKHGDAQIEEALECACIMEAQRAVDPEAQVKLIAEKFWSDVPESEQPANLVEDLIARHDYWQKRAESLEAFKRGVDEALNSGDGSYRP